MTGFRNLLSGKEKSGPATARASSRLRGAIAAAPDKSCSHRALILAALAEGTSRIEHLLESGDVLATADALSGFGAYLKRGADGIWHVKGKPWHSPQAALDLGNSGTGVRLLMGAAARFDLTAVFTGDDSLSRRPMERVLAPLKAMGAQAGSAMGGRLPVRLMGRSRLHPIDYTPPVASAQVKSAVLLAGLGAQGETIVREPRATRDHTEVMAPLFGADLDVERSGEGLVARVRGGTQLKACELAIPGDPSSAAFAVAAGLIAPESEIAVRGVMTNPARFGLYEVLEEMGADIDLRRTGLRCGERLVDIGVRTSALRGVTVPASRAPSMIDEYPILAVIAAFAEGETRMEGLGELRAKESDRLSATADLLSANGVEVRIEGDTLLVKGCGPAGVPGGGRVETRHDHRLAMAGLVMGLASKAPVSVDETAMIATSYPGFFEDMEKLGAAIA